MIRNTFLGLALAAVLPLTAVAQVTPTPAPAQDKPILITGATLNIGNGQVIEKGQILFHKGKIVAVGATVSVPAELQGTLQTIDATGKQIYPGLIGTNSQVGLVEIELGLNALVDHTEASNSDNPNVRAIVAYNTDSHVQPTLRSNGILIAEVAPQGGDISGISSVVTMDAWNYEDASIATDFGLHINWPDMRLFGADPVAQGKSREALQKKLDAMQARLDEVRAYAEARKAGRVSTIDLRLEALIPFVLGQKPVFFHAELVPAIEAAVAFATRNKLKAVLVGGYDAWRIPETLKRAGIPVIYSTPHALPYRNDEDYDLPYKIPKLLADAGVTFCISSPEDRAGVYWKFRNLPFWAGTAAGWGLGKERALQSITLDAARILGIADRVGSLEAGKDATLFISEGDALDMRTSRITRAFIQGRDVNLDNKHEQLYRRFQEKYRQQKAAAGR